MLFTGQLLVRIGVGIDFPVSSSYVSEILPKANRARMMVATIACQSVGMLLAAGMLERDGAFILSGYLATLFTVAFFAAIAIFGVEAVDFVWKWLR